MSKEVDAALEILKGAIRRDQERMRGYVQYFMGLTPMQIHLLKAWYEKTTGKRPEDIT